MSYDIFLRCPTCDQHPERLSPTYNLGSIFRRALAPLTNGIYSLEGMTGAVSILVLQRAHARLVDPSLEDELRALEPDNGWGTLDHARSVIYTMIENAIRFPNSVWDVGGPVKNTEPGRPPPDSEPPKGPNSNRPRGL